VAKLSWGCMKPSERPWSWATLVALVGITATCVPLVEYDDQPCPCTNGYTCCEATQRCLSPDEQCAPQGAGGTGSAGLGGSTPVVDVAGATSDAGGAGQGGGGGQSEPDLSTCAAYSRTSNVLVLIYSPMLESGEDLQTALHLHDGRALSAELAERLRVASAGVIHYDIVEARVVNEWPPQLPGTMVLDEATFTSGVHDPPINPVEGNADYAAIFEDQQLCDAVHEKDISEIWLWGAHSGQVTFGFDTFSYRLAADELPASASAEDEDRYARRRRNLPDCGRTLWIQSGLYSAAFDGIGIAHRNYNFRVEEILERDLRLGAMDPVDGAAIWSEFSKYERGPGDGANVGTPLFPPNAGVWDDGDVTTEDYGDADPVFSGAHLWSTYPALDGEPESISCAAWNCSNEGFQAWYSSHLPHNDGVSPSATCNSWWKYVADPDGDLTPCFGDACSGQTDLGLPCSSDADCDTGFCACQGMWAACSVGEGERCAAPDWAACNDHADCRSGICGCHDQVSPKVCLPDDSFPVECE
jgi:hypothetical protein